jgi:hypothetical protein
MVLRYVLRRIGALPLAILAGALLAAGCGSRTSQLDQKDPSRIRMQTLAIEYARYLNHNGGKLPPNEDVLKKYIVGRGKSFLSERGILSVDELFVSPRDGQPLVVSYGTQKLVRAFSADPIVAHEQKGIQGKRLVAFPSGAVVDLDPDMFDKLQVAKDQPQSTSKNEAQGSP